MLRILAVMRKRPGVTPNEPVMGQGRNAAFKGWLRTATRGLQTDPSQPLARRIGPERKNLVPVEGRDGVPYHLRLFVLGMVCSLRRLHEGGRLGGGWTIPGLQ